MCHFEQQLALLSFSFFMKKEADDEKAGGRGEGFKTPMCRGRGGGKGPSRFETQPHGWIHVLHVNESWLKRGPKSMECSTVPLVSYGLVIQTIIHIPPATACLKQLTVT